MDDQEPSEPLEKFRRAFEVLLPDSQGRVHKSRMKAFFQSTLGQLFQEDMTTRVIEMMRPDQDGLISIEGFMEAFSLNHWSPETLAAMYEVLQNSPEVLSSMTDWKAILTKLGLDITEEDVAILVQQARNCASDLLASQLTKKQPLNPAEVGEQSSLILQAIQEKMNLLDIGRQETRELTKEKKDTEDSSP